MHGRKKKDSRKKEKPKVGKRKGKKEERLEREKEDKVSCKGKEEKNK